jgi:hypothetical protein
VDDVSSLFIANLVAAAATVDEVVTRGTDDDVRTTRTVGHASLGSNRRLPTEARSACAHTGRHPANQSQTNHRKTNGDSESSQYYPVLLSCLCARRSRATTSHVERNLSPSYGRTNEIAIPDFQSSFLWLLIPSFTHETTQRVARLR